MSEASASRVEITLRVVVLGIVLSVVMGAANVYLGLRVGMTVSASIPAAVIGMLVLRLLGKLGARKGTILEANQIQTAASAGESLAAGIIFTMPAMILIGAWTEFDMVMTTLIGFTGGLLGILFMIPMRSVFVVGGAKELTYPEGVACAAVLEAGDDEEEGADSGAMSIVFGALFGALFKVAEGFLTLFHATLEAATTAGNRIFYFGGDVSPALVAVGYIVKLNVAVLIFIGGFLGWLVAIPILGGTPDQLADPLTGAAELWDSHIRYFGVGAMVVGGIATIFRVRHSLVDAVKVVTSRGAAASSESPLERNIPTPAIALFSVLATALVAYVYYTLTHSIAITVATTAIMLVMSFFFTAVASYIVGLVGNSNSPVSGMTITAVLFTGGLLIVFGFSGEQGMVATLGVAAIVCCAACTSGDVCNDLKTGHMVGASPFKQQIMQIVGVAAACFVMGPTLELLHEGSLRDGTGGIGGDALPAPQAGLFASLAEGFFGDGQLQWTMVGAGAALGVVLLLIDGVLERRGSKFRAYLMPTAVGIYLPFSLATPILVGGLLAHWIGRGATDEADLERRGRRGVLWSSGIIAGEALTGVFLAGLATAGFTSFDWGEGAGSWQGPTTVVAAITLVAVFASQIRSKSR